MSEQSRLVTLDADQPGLSEGLPWRFWWPTQRNRATGDVRRRSDREPYTPALRPGDNVFINYAGARRVVAWLVVDGKPEWIDDEEWFEFDIGQH